MLEPQSGFGIAVDIGTTSVVLALVSLSSGEIIARHSFMNPQRVFGPDVISRIDAANQGNLLELKALINDNINKGIELLLNHGDVDIDNSIKIIIAGNTAMIHLLLGLSCDSLGVFPFKPIHQLEKSYSLFGCQAQIIPWLAAFVGGDILAGLLNVLPFKKFRFLLIDLGTNGEMVLYNEGKLMATSTAAGPAFEGSGHKGGASAVLNDLANLVHDGLIDETGLLKAKTPECILEVPQETTEKSLYEQYTFSQKEIRDLQLAKSAVRTGLEILCQSVGLDYADIDAVYLAGGIGQAMNVDSAVTIGLLPEELKEKVTAVGNASLGGAVRLLLMPGNTKSDMDKILANYTEINLAEHPLFNELFINYLAFD